MEFTMTDSDSETSEDISETYSPYCYRHLRQKERKLRKETEEDHVKQLIESGEPISPSILWGAVRWRRSKVVDLLLSAGVDPNRRFAKAEDVMPGGKHDWAEHDWLDRDPDRLCYFEYGGYFPLHLAAMTPFDEESQEEAENMIRSLLRHGADPYAIFAEQLEEPGSSFSVQRPLFPGEETGPKQDPWIAADLWQRKRIERVLGEDHEGIIPPILGLDFGLRSVINAILEDGFYFKPFLDSPEFMKDLQLEHRDPQGRTLFLSACRANRGADEHLSKGSYEDRFSNPDIYHDSGPCPVFPPDNHSTPCAGEARPWTAIQALLNLGADPLATDNQGKNALHQLLEADNRSSRGPPVIRQSLRYLIARFPSLINQADGNGMCPIHTALRRLWQYTTDSTFTDLSSPENCVLDLLEAGANAHARDANGNTVLHYLADGFLDAVDYGERRRGLFNMLLDKYQCAPYVNTPNNLGQTPIQIMLCYSWRREEWHENESHRNWSLHSSFAVEPEPVDVELFGMFDKVATDWAVRDKLRRTLLHNVVQISSWGGRRAEWRWRYLIQKGVDPLARDVEGNTARDLASTSLPKSTLEVFSECENAEANGKSDDAPDKVSQEEEN